MQGILGWVGELGYRLGLAVIDAAYRLRLMRSHRLPATVIGIGNLTWGGTGKTPFLIHLAKALERDGRRVAVLTRGYGKDEVLLMTQRLHPIPILVGADRRATGLAAVRQYAADTLLLDDGYQQWRIKKDLEILVADGLAPYGNGHLIPRGTLREPPQAAARADLVILKRFPHMDPGKLEESEAAIRRFNRKAAIFWMAYRPIRLWDWVSGKEESMDGLKGCRVATLCGLAQPSHFEETVRSIVGVEPALRIRVRDHHEYTTGEMIRFLARCHRNEIHTLITTAKDAVRIPRELVERVGQDLNGISLLVLEIVLEFNPDESQLLHRIRTVLARQRLERP
jgi:tetraacyldisaccharide 4'-kinase